MDHYHVIAHGVDRPGAQQEPYRWLAENLAKGGLYRTFNRHRRSGRHNGRILSFGTFGAGGNPVIPILRRPFLEEQVWDSNQYEENYTENPECPLPSQG